MPASPNNAVSKVIAAAGGKSKLSRELNCSFQAVFQWEGAGWMPLARAKQVMEMYPGVTTLRDLVRSDLKEAMDISAQQTLLD